MPSGIDFVIGLDNKDFYRITRAVPASLFKDWESFTATHSWQMSLHVALNPELRKLLLGSIAFPTDSQVSLDT